MNYSKNVKIWTIMGLKAQHSSVLFLGIHRTVLLSSNIMNSKSHNFLFSDGLGFLFYTIKYRQANCPSTLTSTKKGHTLCASLLCKGSSRILNLAHRFPSWKTQELQLRPEWPCFFWHIIKNKYKCMQLSKGCKRLSFSYQKYCLPLI